MAVGPAAKMEGQELTALWTAVNGRFMLAGAELAEVLSCSWGVVAVEEEFDPAEGLAAQGEIEETDWLA